MQLQQKIKMFGIATPARRWTKAYYVVPAAQKVKTAFSLTTKDLNKLDAVW